MDQAFQNHNQIQSLLLSSPSVRRSPHDYLIQSTASPRPANLTGIAPLSVQQIMTSPVVQQQQQYTPNRIQPNNAEVHHSERPLQVVTLDDMESKWKTKCMQLEVYLFELQSENLRLKGNGPQISLVQDDSKLNELAYANKELRGQEQQLRSANKQLQDELDQWKLRYKQLQESNSKNSGADEELRQLKKKISQLTSDYADSQERNQYKDQEILKLKQLLNDKDNELDSMESRIRELEMQLDGYSQSEQQIISLQSEVELWKKKFKQQNEITSDVSEKLTMAEAQLEAYKKSKVTVTKESEIKRSGPQGGQVSSTVESSSIRGATLTPGGYNTYGNQPVSGRNSTFRNSQFNDRQQL